MADYTGHLIDDPVAGDEERGNIITLADHQWKRYHGWEITSDKSYAGTSSIKLFVGGVYTLDCVCEAGSRTVSAMAWAPINGSIKMEVVDPDTGAVEGSDTTSSTKTWEALSISFTASKKVYLVFIRNLAQSAMVEGEDPCGYVDNIEVA